jgi:DNA-binding protein H-NS
MNEGAPTGDSPEPKPLDQPPSEGFDQHDVSVNPPQGDQLAVSTDIGSEIPPQQRIESQLEPAQEYTVPDGSTEGEVTVSVTDTNPSSSDQPQEDTNPVAPRVDGANYEHDEAKAETMAYATKDFRGKAADNRTLAREQDELRDMATEVEHIRGQKPSLLHPYGLQRHREHQKRITDAEKDYYDIKGSLTKDDRAADAKARRDIPELQEAVERKEKEPLYPPYYSPEERAAAYDEYADRIETWAGALHDHPLSVEFKKAHPGIQFQPKALVRMEDEIETLNLEINEKESETYWETQRALRLHVPIGIVPDEETSDEYQKINDELFKQAKALDEFWARVIDETKIQPLRDRSAMTRNVLNDVRREVGLPVEDQEPAAETQDQPPAEEPETQGQSQGD